MDRALTGAVSKLTGAMGSLRQINDELEQRVEDRTAALATSEATTRAIVEGVADGIVTINERGIIQLFNAAAEKMFGRTAAETVGQNVSCLMEPVLGEQHDGFLMCYLETGQKNIIGTRREVTGRRKDGSTFPMELQVAEVEVAGVRLITGLAQDISVRKEAADALRYAKEVAEQANRAKGEFLANMSHEIRTPMNGIIGMSELALDTDLDLEQREYIGTVLQCANSLLALLNDILDFSKIEAGKLEMESQPFDIVACVESATDPLTMRAGEKQIELVCSVHPDIPPYLQGDSNRIRQVIVNLASNAVKFTEAGEVVVSVDLESRTDQEAVVVFSVRDTGIGIPSDRVAAVFESFTQADGATTRKYGGTGLGLTISKQIVEIMGGSIWVESVDGQGSTFSFRVPFSIPTKTPKPTAPNRRITPDRSDKKYNIMVIDDNATNRRILELLLNAEGDPYDLVLLDMQIPEMDGFTATAHIRDDARWSNLPVVAMTAHALAGDRDRCMRLAWMTT